ncbi:MAG: phosphomannomutase [Pelagimonas sp.]|nr:phosphomannomutase [Pelagimonas sp.]
MPPKFGTSGLRGLVTELTNDLVSQYVQAFLDICPKGHEIYLGWDLRPSSEKIAGMVSTTIQGAHRDVERCGVLPTPALALAAQKEGCAAIMVTGSHIPADRNGLKFYTPEGEITKEQEAQITANLRPVLSQANLPSPMRGIDALGDYAARYINSFGAGALKGLRIGVYQHSSVARDVMVDITRALGATPIPLAPSDTFIPVDTEALDPETRSMLAGWCSEHKLDAVISTDGDADRPMVADAEGRIVPGDVLGALTSLSLGAEIICTPISSNTMIAQMPEFRQIQTTRIGSPYVIDAMEQVLADNPKAKVVGYEANGGFLLGYETNGMAPLLTRDCMLPMLAPLAMAQRFGVTLAQLVSTLPPRFTAADRIKGIETAASKAFIASLSGDTAARAAFFADAGAETALDETDGLRVTFDTGEIVHLRPSGNAPELRCYAEADSADRAGDLVNSYLSKLQAQLG